MNCVRLREEVENKLRLISSIHTNFYNKVLIVLLYEWRRQNEVKSRQHVHLRNAIKNLARGM
jgi:hypothetical protein